MNASDTEDFDATTLANLQTYGFNDALFANHQRMLRNKSTGPSKNQLHGTITPPHANEITDWSAQFPPAAHADLRQRGENALRRGEVGVVILAGGMATRFGGRVKAAVEVLPPRTFLDLKLADIARWRQEHACRIPVFIMTSFATHAVLSEATRNLPDVHPFAQFISLRLTKDGEIWRDAEGRPSMYAPGHGDLGPALRKSGLLEAFAESGGKVLFMSNVDNLAATLDPAMIGFHLQSRKPLTAEVVSKHPGDRGGAPARVDGALQIVEAFRFPDTFDQDQIDIFNTNTFLFDVDVLRATHPLTYFAVQKEVAGEDVIQFEHLIGELTAFVPTAYLKVERVGSASRFLPIKRPEDLDTQRASIAALLEARGIH